MKNNGLFKLELRNCWYILCMDYVAKQYWSRARLRIGNALDCGLKVNEFKLN